MTNNDYRQGYKDGFADGYKKAKEDAGLPFYPPLIPSSPTPTVAGCSVCKREGVWNIVCYHPQCPMRITSVSNTTGSQ